MRKFMITAVAMAGLLNQAHAVRVLTSEQASLVKNNLEVARAYRDREACRVWYWMPRIFKTYTDARHYIDPVSVTIPKTGKVETALASKFEFGAMPQVDFNYQELKKHIADHVNGKLSQSEVPDDYAGCVSGNQRTVSANEIVLNVIPVRKVKGVPVNKDDSDTSVPTYGYESLRIPMAGNGDIYSSPLSKVMLDYMHDATAFSAKAKASDWATKKAGEALGDIVFDIEGVEKDVDSSYIVKGKLSAKFKSSLKKTKCDVSHTENDNAAMGAAIGAIVGGGFVGAAIGSQLFGGSETTTSVCQYNIVTEMISGDVDMRITTEHKGHVDGKYKEVCIDDECKAVPLESWINAKLHAQFVMANMDIVLQKVGEQVFATTTPKGIFNGRDGGSSVNINIKSRLIQNTFSDVPVSSTVVKSADMGSRVDTMMFNDPIISCFRTKHWTQRALYPELGGNNFIPVDFSCVNQ